MPSLYEITEELAAVRDQLEEEGYSEQQILDTIESMSMPFEEKVERMVKWMKELEASAEAKKAESKRLKEAADLELKKCDQVKSLIDGSLKRLGADKVKTPLYTVNYRKGSERVEIDESKLSKEYFVPQPPVPMGKTEFKKLLKEGQEIEGVQIVRGEPTLQIK